MGNEVVNSGSFRDTARGEVVIAHCYSIEELTGAKRESLALTDLYVQSRAGQA